MTRTAPPDAPPPDPKFRPDPELLESLIAAYQSKADKGRPNREDVLPYLLVRAFTPGDRGRAPDLAADAMLGIARPVTDRRLLHRSVRPVAMRRDTDQRKYLPGVRARIQPRNVARSRHPGDRVLRPRLFSGQPDAAGSHRRRIRRSPIGPMPSPCRSSRCSRPGRPSRGFQSRPGLVATVSCLADPGRGKFDANNDRHVAQRSLASRSATSASPG